MKTLFFCLAIVAGSLFNNQIIAQETLFFLNTRNHIGGITDISVNAPTGVIATAGTDNTIRIYNSEDGSLLKVLYLPFQEYMNRTALKTSINSLLFDATGQFIYCAGNLGDINSKQYVVYVFDVNTGQNIAQIDNIVDQVHKMAIYDQQSIIALSLFDGTLLIYKNGECILTDNSAQLGGFLSFNNEGTLYYLSYYGKLFIYSGSDYKKQTVYNTGLNGNPSIFTVNPTGTNIAYGIAAQNQVIHQLTFNGNIKPFNTLKTKYSEPNFYTSAFYSALSNSFITGLSVIDHVGSLFGMGTPKILVWNLENSSSYKTITAVPSGLLIKNIVEVNAEQIAFSSPRDVWGVVNLNNELVYLNESDAIEFDGQRDLLKVSYDGTMVGFGMNRLGDLPITFSVKIGVLESSTFLKPPRLIPSMIEKLQKAASNVQTLPGESIKSFSLTQDNQLLVVGTSHRIICIDLSGSDKWISYTKASAEAVNVSGNGKFCVAALSDGTIHWYNMKTGAEVLALFVNAQNNNKWVLWTPDGKYKASASGQEYLGWLVKQTNGNTIFNASSQMKSLYNAPNYINNLLNQ